MVNLSKWWRSHIAKYQDRKQTRDAKDPGASSTAAPAIFQDRVERVTILGGSLSAAGRDVINNNFYEGSKSVLDQLPKDNFGAIQLDNFAKRTQDTGLWFIEGNEFSKWKITKGEMLWGTGIPGAGKTVLASTVIDHLLKLANTYSDISVSFAYCRYTEDFTVLDILLALIRQQAERHSSVEKAIGPIFAQHQRRNTRPSQDELVEMLKAISKLFKMNFYILDGLDEAKGDVQIKLIRILSSVGANFFLTSRPLKELEGTVPNAIFFPISAQDYDLELMVDERVRDTPRFGQLLESNAGLRQEVISKIKEKSRGMFLHATLQMETLRHCLTVKDLRKRMDAFPVKIEDLYIATVCRINGHPDKEHVRTAKESLIWVLNAERSLTIEELRFALAYSPETQSFDEDGRTPEDVLLSLCFGLITVDKESRFVRLVHYTAKDVLKRLLACDFPHPHEFLATTCIARVLSCDFQRPNIQNLTDLKDAYEANTFLNYAHDAWGFHTRQCDGRSPVWDAASRFVWGCQNFPQAESTEYEYDRFHPLHLIARHNLAEILNPARLAGDEPRRELDINAHTTKSRRTALIIASHQGHEEVVDILLQAPDIDVNSTTKSCRTALIEACRQGRRGVVSRLLNAPGIDVNALDKEGSTALKYAAKEGHIGVVDLLLDVPEIDVNLVRGNSWNPLMGATYAGRCDVVERLLRGPNVQVNAPDWDGDPSLMLATERGHEDVVSLLLGAPGIEVNHANRNGQTALMVAASNGKEEMVKLLLDSPGVRSDVVDNDGNTALSLASESRHNGITKLLEGFQAKSSTGGPSP